MTITLIKNKIIKQIKPYKIWEAICAFSEIYFSFKIEIVKRKKKFNYSLKCIDQN